MYNSAFIQALPSSVLTKARQLANYHEAGVFSSPNLSSIHNGWSLFLAFHFTLPIIFQSGILMFFLDEHTVPGRAILPKLLDSVDKLSKMAYSSDSCYGTLAGPTCSKAYRRSRVTWARWRGQELYVHPEKT